MTRLLLASFVLVFAAQANAAGLCAKFVCIKGETCHYRVVSSRGPARNVNLYYGHEISLSGLGPGTSYCDWAGGRCITPMRPVQSLTACQ